VTALIGLTYLRTGDQPKAAAILRDLETRKPLPAIALAQWYAVAGDRNRAIAFLERVKGEEFGPAAEVDPVFDNLRADARFAPLARGGR
jgi:hypothetical protein